MKEIIDQKTLRKYLFHMIMVVNINTNVIMINFVVEMETKYKEHFSEIKLKETILNSYFTRHELENN